MKNLAKNYLKYSFPVKDEGLINYAKSIADVIGIEFLLQPRLNCKVKIINFAGYRHNWIQQILVGDDLTYEG